MHKTRTGQQQYTIQPFTEISMQTFQYKILLCHHGQRGSTGPVLTVITQVNEDG